MNKILLLVVVEICISIYQLLKQKRMDDELKKLQDAVEKSTTVQESAIILLSGLKGKLDDAIAKGDPAALRSLSDSLGTESTKLADAILANTPSEPAPTPVPETTPTPAS